MKVSKIAKTTILIAIAFVFLATFNNVAQDSGNTNKYTGSKKCKLCHSAAKKGGQFKSWENSQHSKAFATLATPEAKKIAEGLGIADPQKDAKCLKCHVTAFGVDSKLLGEKYTMEEGVGCESCHGAGEKYEDKDVMTDLSLGKITPESVGLKMPTEQLCVTCHNSESPTYKPFVFEEKYKLIAHPMPEEFMKEKGYPSKKK